MFKDNNFAPSSYLFLFVFCVILILPLLLCVLFPTEDHLSSWVLGNLIFIQMPLRVEIELDIFNIIANAGSEAQISAAEIVEKISTFYSTYGANFYEHMAKETKFDKQIQEFMTHSTKPFFG